MRVMIRKNWPWRSLNYELIEKDNLKITNFDSGSWANDSPINEIGKSGRWCFVWVVVVVTGKLEEVAI